ncbi:4372_t:CDS:10 [Gigaspora margarita]|uniref:dolichol kinase n=1 Tax=Gigaspora margarita TaxID=4874 RepID=A0ABN7UE09_GIGMA|nr:4372_t:CDS:10 [Gigaspora margarita]
MVIVYDSDQLTSSSTSEEEIDPGVEIPPQKNDFGNKKMTNFFPSPIPITASVFERGVIFSISLYASIRLVRILAANEVGRMESLDLILLAIWTWCVYSFDLPFSNKDEKLSHMIWGTDEKCYRNDVDDGAFYGTLLIPTVAAAKLVDIHRSTNVQDDINIEFFEANFELCIVMGCGILIHMFMSKHVNLPNMSVIWAMSIATILSIILIISMAKLGLLPLFETVVAQAITLLAVELWVITVKKFRLVKIPSLNQHFPSDITIFQIGLILGMFFIGIILSPLLIHSRNLAQRPAWKIKRKRVFQNNGRKWTSFALLVGTSLIPEFMHLAFSVALSAFIFLEYLRYFAVYPLGKNIHIFLSEFLDNRDSGPCILSHLYLLVGCAACIWMQGTSVLANISGILTLGLGDAMASIVGKRYGRRRWPGTTKTIEGSIAFIIFHLLGAFVVTRLWSKNNLLPGIEEWLYYTLAVSIADTVASFQTVMSYGLKGDLLNSPIRWLFAFILKAQRSVN